LTTRNFLLSDAKFETHDNGHGTGTDIAVLIRVNDVFSEDLVSVDILVDPWRLLDTNEMSFDRGWLTKGVMKET
jgi:hypothetical protein